MSYGNDLVDVFRQAAPYVDRILRGDRPADLPVQAATKFETIINLKTAKTLGVAVPPGLLVAADEIIEQGLFAALHMSAAGTLRLTSKSLSRSLLGVKRTWVPHRAMSAFDP
jgi:hypothetical protein